MFDFSQYFIKKTQNRTYTDLDASRMAAYFVQNGRCYVTGAVLEKGQRELHHRKPRQYGGKDEPENLILLTRTVHKMVHARGVEEFKYYWQQMPLTEEQLHMVNHLRMEAHTSPMAPTKREVS